MTPVDSFGLNAVERLLKGLPHWPAFDAAAPGVMEISDRRVIRR
jgi:hypothetical protein